MSSSLHTKTQFIDKILDLVQSGEPFKMTLSKPRHQNKDIANIYLKPAVIKDEMRYVATYRYRRKDEVKNYRPDMMHDFLNHALNDLFFNAVVFHGQEEITLLQSKKGKATVIVKNEGPSIMIDTSHDVQKYRYIPEDAAWLQDLKVASKDGKILDKAQDKYRQINKFIEIIDHMLKDFPEDQLINIADMGSGKGYLTFAIYDYLTNTRKMRCRVTGYEVREDIVGFCYNVAIKHGFVGLTFQQKNIEETDVSGVNMVMALHACDIATDMAIAKGIQAAADYIIVAPCCHKQIRKSMKHNNLLSPILQHGILEERQAEIITDGIRSLIMEASGYRTKVFEFISVEHTPKNVMITGVKSIPDPEVLKKVEAIESFYGIDYHYLEVLLGYKSITTKKNV